MGVLLIVYILIIFLILITISSLILTYEKGKWEKKMKKKIDLYHRDNYVVFLFSFGNFGNFPKMFFTHYLLYIIIHYFNREA